MFQRFTALMAAAILIIAIAALPAGAAAQPSSESATATQPATEQPTYADYIRSIERTVYDGELGAIYTKKATTFRLWAPTAKNVRVCIYKTGSDDESGAQLVSNNAMNLSKSTGVWYLTLKGDYKNLYYTYRVDHGDTSYEVVDPYAKAAGVNGERGMIVDLSSTDPEGWDSDSFSRVTSMTDATVWEISIRDFSADESSGVSTEHRGRYLAFTEEGTTLNSVEGELSTCIDYLKELHVGYVQIGPFYDFASVDEAQPIDDQYNWGYDPKNYNVPEGSYSTNPYDGRVRIKECKQMIEALHSAGIGVIMDVVYNHTYESEDSFFNRIVPDYYYRMNENGIWSNGSGCGNDIATERYMVSRYIRDSVTYWADEYHIDGFRFDLMGLIDVDTMNAVRQSLNSLKNGKRILMYGEAWQMETDTSAKLANQQNMNLLLDGIAAFNDEGRDGIKGSTFSSTEVGFVQSGSSKGAVRTAIEGQADGWAGSPDRCVNYASCHDNLTLYDKLVSSVYRDESYTLRHEDLVSMNKLSAAIVLTSRGMPFLLAGEEFGRTKLGDNNSYLSPISVNRLNWSYLHRYTSMIEYYKGLIQLRQNIPLLRDSTGNIALSYLEGSNGSSIAYTLSDEENSVAVIMNGSAADSTDVTLPQGDWVQLADADRAGLCSLGEFSGKVTVPASSCAVFVTSGHYDVIGVKDETCHLYVQYVNRSDNTVVYEDHLVGMMGESYAIAIPEEVRFQYDVTVDDEKLSGAFSKEYAVVKLMCERYEGEFSQVTFRFVDKDDKELSNAIVLKNRIGQQYVTPAMPHIDGYRLDLDALPENGAGTYTSDEIEVVYRYIPDEGVESEDLSLSCRANVIYMGNGGEILATKSYLGTEGIIIDLSILEFEDYAVTSISDDSAMFEPVETTVIINYKTTKVPDLKYLYIALGAIAMIGLLSLFIGHSGKNKKLYSIEIDDEIEDEIES